MNNYFLILPIIIFSILTCACHAEVREYQVKSVIDGDTVMLENGKELRLTGIQAPKLPLGRKDFVAWPLAKESRQALINILKSVSDTNALGKIRIEQHGRAEDRHGRILGHAFTPDGRWVQGQMVAKGMARVYSFADNRWRVADLLLIEAKARLQRAGIWQNDFYKIYQAADKIPFGDFSLVEGRVLQADTVRGVTYLNFGDDYRSDFTIRIARQDLKVFALDGIDPLSFEGKALRVRGWVSQRGGPMIRVTHPEQIEILSDETH